MNYLTDVADAIRRELDPSLFPHVDDEDALFRLYAVLTLAKGTAVTAEDVHNAWVAWMSPQKPDHPSIQPFFALSSTVQKLDDPFVRAIHTVALSLKASEVSLEFQIIADGLVSDSLDIRRAARMDIDRLDEPSRVTFIHYLAACLYLRRAKPDIQMALGTAISSLAPTPGAAVAAAAELRLIPHRMITELLPIALFVYSRPEEFRAVIIEWLNSPKVSSKVRRMCKEVISLKWTFDDD